MIRADLHTHTTRSDGSLSPTQLVLEASARGITHLLVSDHDTTAGIAEAREAARNLPITVLAGVEMTVRYQSATLHLLGVGIDPDHAGLAALNERTRKSRRERYREMLRLLREEVGISTMQENIVMPSHDDSLTRPHLARELMKRGHTRSVQEAFDRWLGRGRPAFVPHEALPIAEAIAAIRDAGGLSSLAHCAKYQHGVRMARALLDEQGMDSVEVIHPDHDFTTRQRLRDILNYRKRPMTGGSDFHGFDHSKSQCFGQLYLEGADAEALLESLSACSTTS